MSEHSLRFDLFGSVRLLLAITCASCERRLDAYEYLEPESLVTGNATERASYHYAAHAARLQADANRRGWSNVEGKPCCAHCLAKVQDPHS